MKEVRWHGRGGQGAKSMSQVLAEAWLQEGRYVQAFPEYGPERSGAPVAAYTRMSERPIRIHHAVRSPDAVVVLDPTLLGEVPVAAGLKPEGFLLVNSQESLEQWHTQEGLAGRLLRVPAENLAREAGARFANVVMLGALARELGGPRLEMLSQAFSTSFAKLAPKHQEANLRALEAGYRFEPQETRREPAKARPPDVVRSLADLPGGAVLAEDAYHPSTGGWRAGIKPVVDLEACVSCLLCWVYCPDAAIHTDGKNLLGFDYDHCKGCELCVKACPTGAITMLPEHLPLPSSGLLRGLHG